jgi:nitrogen regulatory protein A
MMDRVKKNEFVMDACDQLMGKLRCDFVGLALQAEDGPEVRWHYAIGNTNDKYKRITLRYGKGIAGKVIATGRPMTINQFPEHIQGKELEYPIMLAEKLIASFAMPIFKNGSPKGVLLLGQRKAYLFSEEDQRVTEETANMLGNLLSSHP